MSDMTRNFGMEGDERRARILEAAMHTVGTYGFKRTSMDDLAKAVGISRPALYQHFSSKRDIYRAVLQNMCDASLDAAQQASAAQDDLVSGLRAAIEAAVLQPHAVVEDWPHGDELLSLKGELGQDIMNDWAEQFQQILKDILSPKAGALAEDLALVIARTIDGAKAHELKSVEMRNEVDRVLSVVKRAAST